MAITWQYHCTRMLKQYLELLGIFIVFFLIWNIAIFPFLSLFHPNHLFGSRCVGSRWILSIWNIIGSPFFTVFGILRWFLFVKSGVIQSRCLSWLRLGIDLVWVSRFDHLLEQELLAEHKTGVNSRDNYDGYKES